MFYQVRPSQLPAWFGQFAQTQGQPIVLDVREHWEHQICKLPPDQHFELLCIPMSEVPARLQELPPQRPIACLCHHGARSMRVAAYLTQQGFSAVANITGGIDAWAHECDSSIGCY